MGGWWKDRSPTHASKRGGFKPRAGAITTGLPFTVVLLLMCFSLYKGLSAERKLMTANP